MEIKGAILGPNEEFEPATESWLEANLGRIEEFDPATETWQEEGTPKAAGPPGDCVTVLKTGARD